jgi:hypothetical protein
MPTFYAKRLYDKIPELWCVWYVTHLKSSLLDVRNMRAVLTFDSAVSSAKICSNHSLMDSSQGVLSGDFTIVNLSCRCLARLDILSARFPLMITQRCSPGRPCLRRRWALATVIVRIGPSEFESVRP